jgi:hypothetical protein
LVRRAGCVLFALFALALRQMPTYRLTIERTVRFQLDLEADTRLDALRMVNDTALVYDGQDLKETRVIAIKELKEDAVLNPLD